MNSFVTLALAAAGAFGVPDAAAADTDTLTLREAIALAASENPGLRAARLRADAAAERVAPAGAWADPMLSLGLMNRPVGDVGRTDQPMTMNSVQLTQRFPWPGKLGFGSEQARRLAAVERLESEEAEVRLVARVKEAYYQLAYLDRALAVMRETRDLLRNFQEVSSAMYGVGTALQQDVLQAQVAVASMTEDITVAEQQRVAQAARLNALLGRPPETEVGALELPPPPDALPPVERLMELASANRPLLRAARERVEAARAGRRAAGRAAYPDVTVTLGYAQRPQYEDFTTLMVGLSVPLFAGSRYAPREREMEAMAAAAEAGETDAYNETYARLAELSAEAARSRNLSALYRTSVLPQARAAVESALSAYRVGEVDYMTLVNSELTVNRYDIETIRLVAEYHRAVAQVEALVGVELRTGQ